MKLSATEIATEVTAPLTKDQIVDAIAAVPRVAMVVLIDTTAETTISWVLQKMSVK